MYSIIRKMFSYIFNMLYTLLICYLWLSIFQTSVPTLKLKHNSKNISFSPKSHFTQYIINISILKLNNLFFLKLIFSNEVIHYLHLKILFKSTCMKILCWLVFKWKACFSFFENNFINGFYLKKTEAFFSFINSIKERKLGI